MWEIAQKVRLIRRQSVNLFDKAAYDMNEICATHQLQSHRNVTAVQLFRQQSNRTLARFMRLSYWNVKSLFVVAMNVRKMCVSLSVYQLNCQFYPFHVLENWQLLLLLRFFCSIKKKLLRAWIKTILITLQMNFGVFFACLASSLVIPSSVFPSSHLTFHHSRAWVINVSMIAATRLKQAHRPANVNR